MYPYHKITNIHILLLLVTYIDIVCIPNNTMVVLLYFDINESVKCKLWTLDILFRHIATFIKLCVAFVFGLQTL